MLDRIPVVNRQMAEKKRIRMRAQVLPWVYSVFCILIAFGLLCSQLRKWVSVGVPNDLLFVIVLVFTGFFALTAFSVMCGWRNARSLADASAILLLAFAFLLLAEILASEEVRALGGVILLVMGTGTVGMIGLLTNIKE